MISGIVLSAGLSTRMGEPKALLDWGGEPLISYQVRQLKEAGCDEVVVVLGHRSDAVHRAIRRLPCRVMVNARYQMGRAWSLRLGARAVNRDADMIVVVNVDQPRPAALIRQLLFEHKPESAATRPSHAGHHGHPIVVSGRLRDELLQATDEDEGLRGILRRHAGEIGEVEGGPECLTDLNTPEDYRQAVAAAGVAH